MRDLEELEFGSQHRWKKTLGFISKFANEKKKRDGKIWKIWKIWRFFPIVKNGPKKGPSPGFQIAKNEFVSDTEIGGKAIPP